MAKCVKIKRSEDETRQGRFTLYFSDVKTEGMGELEAELLGNSAVQTLYAYTIENKDYIESELIEKFVGKEIKINCFDFTIKELVGVDTLEWKDEDLSPMSSRHIATFDSRSVAKEKEATRIRRGIDLGIWVLPKHASNEEGAED